MPTSLLLQDATQTTDAGKTHTIEATSDAKLVIKPSIICITSVQSPTIHNIELARTEEQPLNTIHTVLGTHF